MKLQAEQNLNTVKSTPIAIRSAIARRASNTTHQDSRSVCIVIDHRGIANFTT